MCAITIRKEWQNQGVQLNCATYGQHDNSCSLGNENVRVHFALFDYANSDNASPKSHFHSNKIPQIIIDIGLLYPPLPQQLGKSGSQKNIVPGYLSDFVQRAISDNSAIKSSMLT